MSTVRRICDNDNAHALGFYVSFLSLNMTNLALVTNELSNNASSKEAHKNCELRVCAYI